jgi:hypothetical protein
MVVLFVFDLFRMQMWFCWDRLLRSSRTRKRPSTTNVTLVTRRESGIYRYNTSSIMSQDRARWNPHCLSDLYANETPLLLKGVKMAQSPLRKRGDGHHNGGQTSNDALSTTSRSSKRRSAPAVCNIVVGLHCLLTTGGPSIERTCKMSSLAARVAVAASGAARRVG